MAQLERGTAPPDPTHLGLRPQIWVESVKLARNFPENSLNVTLQKVRKTGERLAGAAAEGGGLNKIEFRLVSHPLGYSAQCFDNRVLILSVFEMYRDGKIGSPAFVIDLQKAPEVAKWWAKELAGLERESHLAPIAT